MIIMKSPRQMVERISAMVAKYGERTASNSRSTTYVYKRNGFSISVTYFGEEVASLTINGENDFSITDAGEVACIKGNPKALLEAYDCEESLKD